jgi:CheY-like chemotaxis protein
MPPPPAEAAPVLMNAETARSLRILVGEDNPANQLLISRLLAKRGHSVELAGNGREVVDAWQRSAYDLILMDLQMPVMGGIEATREIRSREKATAEHIPILALTAHVVGPFREQCAREGMDGYLTKPIRPVELDLEIRQIADSSPILHPHADLPPAGPPAFPGDAPSGRERIDGNPTGAVRSKS